MWLQDVRKRKAGLEVKERHGQTCVPGALLVRVDTIQAALSLVSLLPFFLSCCMTGSHTFLLLLLHDSFAHAYQLCVLSVKC